MEEVLESRISLARKLTFVAVFSFFFQFLLFMLTKAYFFEAFPFACGAVKKTCFRSQKWKSTILEIERVIIPSGVQGVGGGGGQGG